MATIDFPFLIGDKVKPNDIGLSSSDLAYGVEYMVVGIHIERYNESVVLRPFPMSPSKHYIAVPVHHVDFISHEVI